MSALAIGIGSIVAVRVSRSVRMRTLPNGLMVSIRACNSVSIPVRRSDRNSATSWLIMTLNDWTERVGETDKTLHISVMSMTGLVVPYAITPAAVSYSSAGSLLYAFG